MTTAHELICSAIVCAGLLLSSAILQSLFLDVTKKVEIIGGSIKCSWNLRDPGVYGSRNYNIWKWLGPERLSIPWWSRFGKHRCSTQPCAYGKSATAKSWDLPRVDVTNHDLKKVLIVSHQLNLRALQGKYIFFFLVVCVFMFSVSSASFHHSDAVLWAPEWCPLLQIGHTWWRCAI